MSFPKRVEDALSYNEQKVAKGVAHLLDVQGYLRKPEDLNWYQKLDAFRLRNSLNERATSKTIHISLNFSPQDRKLDAATLSSIASDYMQGIGFGKQPYLVYQHQDAGHPHLHIVSTTIREDGSRIPTHNLGKMQSSKMRTELEAKYNLVPAKGRTLPETAPSLLTPHPAQYGREETRQAIARVVNYVFRQYAFNSLPQYNAALGQYGVVADGGREESRVHRHRGLLYRMLDAQGNKTGVPVKASLLPGKPTLTALEAKFRFAAKRKEWAQPGVVRKVEGALNSSTNMQQFTQALKLAGIYALPRHAANGSLYGITFVDNKNRTVFNGSELGKDYSAAAIQARLNKEAASVSVHQMITPNIPYQHQPYLPKINLHDWQLKSLTHVMAAHNTPMEPPPPTALTKIRRRKSKGNIHL